MPQYITYSVIVHISSVEGEFTKVLATEEWRISRVNQNYTICPAYAKGVVVPKSIDDETLSAAATFRQGGRFPVLSYRHNNGVNRVILFIITDLPYLFFLFFFMFVTSELFSFHWMD